MSDSLTRDRFANRAVYRQALNRLAFQYPKLFQDWVYCCEIWHDKSVELMPIIYLKLFLEKCHPELVDLLIP